MMNNKKFQDTGKANIQPYTGNVFRIVLLASCLICLSVIVTGILSYTSIKNALIAKSKSQDMVFIVKSMSERIQGRIQRAMETSYIIARNPWIIKWIEGSEQDAELSQTVMENLHDIATSYDYHNTFIASLKTQKYYFEDNVGQGKSTAGIYQLSRKNPADLWFYNFLANPQPISLNVNYDRGMDDTFLFVNALVGNSDNPLGIAGVGLSLHDISAEFHQFKVGQQSSLWLVDENGIIQLSDDLNKRGKNFGQFIPAQVVNEIRGNKGSSKNAVKVSEYTNSNGEIIDIAFHKLDHSNWMLVYQIPRAENISVINTLRRNTIITIALVLLFAVTLFYLVSRKIANPYKQALLLNLELEKKVNDRTVELREINQKVMDSIDYAQKMQESILPSADELKTLFQDYFLIWRPKDVVGGDFYWARQIGDTIILAVGDCTGHGVPGALLTMTVNAILFNIVTDSCRDNPAHMLEELNQFLKQVLNKDINSAATDDGLDIAICCIKNKSELIYAGANIDLHLKSDRELKICKSYKKGVGYAGTIFDEGLTNTVLPVQAGDVFILSSDGFLHQNGGDKDYPFGKKRFYDLIKNSSSLSLEMMKNEFATALQEYMKDEPQRDDIVVLGFKLG